MLLLQLLRPHLYELDLDSERRRQGVPRLTQREWQVLTLVAQGYGNADIARLLFTSTSTVRKHMEHIFDQTGVRTRTAAVPAHVARGQEVRGHPRAGNDAPADLSGRCRR